MAKRPVFISKLEKGKIFKKALIEFEWFPGFAVIQKQKSITDLHAKTIEKYPELKILEISSKSLDELGINLSAFNLMINTKNNMTFSVETAFQASKVFKLGGPYDDLYLKSSKEAKKDIRLKNSGDLIKFKYFNREFPIEPKTFFYNWLYINALVKNEKLAQDVLEYNAFTDIEFNPDKSINCQAESVAIYVSLVKNDLLETALKSINDFKQTVYGNEVQTSEKNQQRSEQIRLL
ncbi:hypothetical protein [Lysinibacillus sp. fls2-241-R2A-57]|uniref:DarT1-associated NADAR antitoxin family protein n=1 Tax=Lysinibacillus sp. fls2-241-R2A-57 TaxID=3040292 RepID=UPI0025560D59|nr:hypothetical protein [Lysinibacillus sp. fls2-241-R2A-57]